MSDPLSSFRKQTANTPSESAFNGADEYFAFVAKDRVERLKIKRANSPTHAPGYAYLLDIIYDGNFGTDFVLVYTILGVKVTGRNLQPVIMALLAGTADYIQEGGVAGREIGAGKVQIQHWLPLRRVAGF
jgi:hypothetical protein